MRRRGRDGGGGRHWGLDAFLWRGVAFAFYSFYVFKGKAPPFPLALCFPGLILELQLLLSFRKRMDRYGEGY